MMKNKKAQISVFILVGVLLLLLIIGVVFYKEKVKQDDLQSQEDLLLLSQMNDKPIDLYVKACIEHTTLQGLSYVGFQGGYYSTPQPSHNMFFLDIPVYWNQGNQNVPSIERIETELGNYIDDNLVSCLNLDSEMFSELTILGEGKSKVKFFQDRVDVDINLPMELRNEERVQKKEDFSETISFDFLSKYEVIEKFMDEQETVGDYQPVSGLMDLAVENGFKFELIYEPGKTIVYAFVFPDLLLGEYLYVFSSRYIWPDIEDLGEDDSTLRNNLLHEEVILSKDENRFEKLLFENWQNYNYNILFSSEEDDLPFYTIRSGKLIVNVGRLLDYGDLSIKTLLIQEINKTNSNDVRTYPIKLIIE